MSTDQKFIVMHIRFYVLFILAFLVISLPLKAQIVINEISYNPPESGNDSLEYVEIYNAGFGHVDITGWRFEGGLEDTFPSVDLAAGEFFVTAINAQAMENVYGITVHEWMVGALNNNGELIILVDAGGNVIDSVHFDDIDPWPLEPDGFGPSLELIDAASDNAIGSNWQFSGGATGVIINGMEVFGTPGAENSGGGSSGPAVIINADNLQFEPKNVVVAIGDSVRWVNTEAVQHNVNGQKSTFPTNTEDFFSGAPAVGSWQYDHEFNLAGLNNYRCDVHFNMGMVGTVSVYDPDNYTDFPLEHLRLTDGVNGTHIFDGVPTRVTGVVHGINFQPSGYSFYIINENNVGINVFSFNPGTYTVTEGDKLEIAGVIDAFNGLLEIVPDEITILSSGNATVAPNLIDEISEELEGSHIVFGPYAIDSIVATGVSGFNVYVTHEETSSKVLIRVDSDSGIDQAEIESSNYARGIGTQFDPSFPFTSGYQLLALELQFFSGIPNIDRDAIQMTPNPAGYSVSFKSDFSLLEIEVYTMDGKSIQKQKVDGFNIDLKINNLPEGLYTIKAQTSEGIWTSLLSVVR